MIVWPSVVLRSTTCCDIDCSFDNQIDCFLSLKLYTVAMLESIWLLYQSNENSDCGAEIILVFDETELKWLQTLDF